MTTVGHLSQKCKCGGKLFWKLGIVDGKPAMIWFCEICKEMAR